jgi:hypothetical protein
MSEAAIRTGEEPIQYVCPVCNIGYRSSDLDLNMRRSRKPKCRKLHRLRSVRDPIGAAVVAFISGLFMVFVAAVIYLMVRTIGPEAPFLFALPLILATPCLIGSIFQLGTWLRYRNSKEPANGLARPGFTSGITLLGIVILALIAYMIALQQGAR